MDTISDLLDTTLDVSEFHKKYGLKGCILAVLAVVLIIGGVIAAAYIFFLIRIPLLSPAPPHS